MIDGVLDPQSASVGFAASCDEVTDVLLRGSGIEHWLVTRTTRESQRVLASAGSAFVLHRRSTHGFDDSICARMISGGPRCEWSVPDSPSYSTAPMALKHGIGAYVGAVIFDADGSVFGTLAGLDTRRHPPRTDGLDRQVHLHAALLSMRLAEARGASAVVPTELDPLTGFATAASWSEVLAVIERQCQVFGDDGTVAAIRVAGVDQLRAREGRMLADEAVRELAYAIRTTLPGVAGHGLGDSFVVALRNGQVDLARLRRVLSDIATAAGLVVDVEVAHRRWSEAGGLVAAEARAWSRLQRTPHAPRSRRMAAAR
jgi:GGDEF domain-containing protein